MLQLNSNDSIPEILPAYKEKNIAIVFETSEVFVPYLSVALLSLADTCDSENNYDIIILTCEVKEQDEIQLKKIVAERKNFSIRFVNPHLIVQEYIVKAHYSYLEINYYRLALPWILTKYNKIINLGADVVVRRDLADLYNTDLSAETYMAGVVDLGYLGRLSIDVSPNELGMDNPYEYVNADVLLLNLETIRERFSKHYLMNLWQKRKFICAEQDVFNLAFDGHVLHLDMKWNVYPERMASEYHIEHAPEHLFIKRKECLIDPYIIHYAAYPKPWDYPMVGCGFTWWEYARRSIYYEEIIRRMSIVACRSEGISSQQVGVKGALINYFKKHCPKFLRPVAKKIKKLLRW